MKLLFFGHGSDPVCNYLRQAWSTSPGAIYFLDLDWIDRCCKLDRDSSRTERSWSIQATNWQLKLGDISAVFLRFLGVDRAIRSGIRLATEKPGLEAAANFWMDLLEGLECPIVNRLSVSNSNHSKLFQLLQMKVNGFLVPDTLVTNDIGLAKAFFARHSGRVVFKSASGARARAQLLDEHNYERLHLLSDCPTQFQQFIPGSDVRVHVIGNQCFGLQIESAELDYRYAPRDLVLIKTCPLPKTIQDQCRRITHAFGLYLSGIDFRVTSKQEWYGLEVNPAPAFTDYQRQTGQPLAATLLNFLAEFG